MTTNRIAIMQQDDIHAIGISPSEGIKWGEKGFHIKSEVQMPTKLGVLSQGQVLMTAMKSGRAIDNSRQIYPCSYQRL